MELQWFNFNEVQPPQNQTVLLKILSTDWSNLEMTPRIVTACRDDDNKYWKIYSAFTESIIILNEKTSIIESWAFSPIEEAADRHQRYRLINKWINTNFRLPTPNTLVLIYYYDKILETMKMGIGRMDYSMDWLIDDIKYDKDKIQIYYWLVLPDEPLITSE